MKQRTFVFTRKPTRRRRGVKRLFVLGAAFAASTMGAEATVAKQAPVMQRGPADAGEPQVSPTHRFSIAEGSLADVLVEFERVTGIRPVLADPGLGVITSPGVTGTWTPAEAMRRLLMGTSVGARFEQNGVVRLNVGGVSESVTVEGEGPAVSSPKLRGPLRDIPQTINVIPQTVIREQGATTLRDVLRNVPGITFQAGEGGGGLPGDNMTMRGFSAGNDIFVDGIRDTGGYTRDAFNLEQVEVAKGPSSSIAGRGTTGGAINQVTKTPHAAERYDVSFGVGNAEYRRGTLDMNTPIGESRSAAVRVSAMWTDTGVPGRNVVENSSWGVAPSVSLGLGSPTQVTFKYQHLSQDNVPDYGLPWGSYAGFLTGAFDADPPVDQANFYGLRNYDFEEIRSDIATADISHRFSGAMTLRNVTRYSETDRDSAITAPRPPNRQLQRRTMANGNLANHTTLTADIGGGRMRHSAVAGLEVARETTENRNSAQSANQPATNIVHPDPAERPFGPMPANTGNPSETRLNLVGAYLFDTWHVGERLQVTGGARFDTVDVDYALTTLATGDVTRVASSDSMLSWRAGAVFKPQAAGSIYVGYGTSFNPSVDAAATGAALGTGETAANNPNLDPEEARNIEVGTKWEVAGSRLALSGALFRTEKVNARTRNANSDPFILEGEQVVRGVELGASGSITPRWTALLSYAFMDSEIAASANAAEQGGNLALVPESTFSAWTTYRLPWEVTVGGGVQYMDAVFRNAINTLRVPSYWLTNALVSYGVNRNLTLRLNAQNLTDEQYVDRVGGGHYIPGPRRQVTVNADVGF